MNEDNGSYEKDMRKRSEIAFNVEGQIKILEKEIKLRAPMYGQMQALQ